MYSLHVLTVLLSALAVALAYGPPSYSGYTLKWSSQFLGKKNTLPSKSEWNIIANSQVFNNEYEVYKSSTNNLRLTGGGVLQIIPQKDKTAAHGWTSGRIESTYTFTPTKGRNTILQARLRLGSNPASEKQGIWPAFWLLGNTYRKGVKWPGTGEIDIMENVNGQNTAVGGVHCGTNPGGICNEPIGLGSTTSLPDANFHSWRVEFNRRATSWKDEFIIWRMDGKEFKRVTGAQIGDQKVWATLCEAPLYIILNVAVGGNWPGVPNSKTLGGSGSMMEVAYVAHYVSDK